MGTGCGRLAGVGVGDVVVGGGPNKWHRIRIGALRLKGPISRRASTWGGQK